MVRVSLRKDISRCEPHYIWEVFTVLLREGEQRMLLLTWGSWGTLFSKQAWRRNSWAPGISHLSFQPRHPHRTGWAHFTQTLMRKTALALHRLHAGPHHGAGKATASTQGCDRGAAHAVGTGQWLQGCPCNCVCFLSHRSLSRDPSHLPPIGLIDFTTVFPRFIKEQLSDNASPSVSTTGSMKANEI